MKSQPTFHFRSQPAAGPGNAEQAQRRSRRGFTLVEILTSLAVMAIMTAMLGTMILTMGQTWKNAQQRVNNFTKARSMLDMLDNDLQAGLYRPDLPAVQAVPGNTTLGSSVEFYTMRPGISSTQPVRNISAVSYQINSTSNVLQRADQSYQWSASIAFGASTAFPTGGIPRDTAPGMVDFKVLYVQQDGTLSYTYSTDATNPTRAVGVTLAVVDDQTLPVLSANQISALRSALDAIATTPTRSVKANWESYLTSTSMNWKSYPAGLGVGLKIFERYVILPNDT